jgi:glucosamine-6-phosphate deaminase
VPLIRVASMGELSAVAADCVAAQLQARPASVLALPTGATPIGLYAQLVARARAGSLNLRDARIFNLDEYAGLAPTNPRSYAAFMHRHLIDPLGLSPDRISLLRGDAKDLVAECRRYDAALATCGGIDLCVLGLGVNGHIAFNEPGDDWNLRTHVVTLSATTRAVHADDWAAQADVPDFGITLGIRNLLESRHVLLLIAGSNKAAAAAAYHRGTSDPDWPVTCLSAHPNVTTIELCVPAHPP